MLEKEIEKRLGTELKKRGCLFYKFVSYGNAGVPDRIVITTSGQTIYVELKTETGRLSRLQQYQIARIEKQGATVRVLYGMKDAERFLQEVSEGGV